MPVSQIFAITLLISENTGCSQLSQVTSTPNVFLQRNKPVLCVYATPPAN